MGKIFKIGGVLEVNRIGFGSMGLTSGHGKWGPPSDSKRAIDILRTAIELGVNLIDTADMYGPGISEELIHKALFPYPKGLVIATKGGNTIYGPSKVVPNCSPTHLRNAVHESLRRLKIECIDLYQLHTVDPMVDIEYSIEELVKLQLEDKIRFIGVSNIDIENFNRARSVGQIATVQNRFNSSNKGSEDILKLTQKLNIGFMNYYPLAKGHLARENFSEQNIELPPAQKELLWQLTTYPNIIPIPGTTSFSHLTENLHTLNLLQN